MMTKAKLETVRYLLKSLTKNAIYLCCDVASKAYSCFFDQYGRDSL